MKKILSLILCTVMLLSASCVTLAEHYSSFTDVATDSWYYEDVDNAVRLGIINGKTATTFAPDDNLTYAEAIKLAACMHQLYTEGAVTLKNGNPWYQSYVDYCADNGIIDKYYDYNEKATRSGYMVIFAHALPDKALPKINDVPDNSIPDVPMTRAYAPEVYKLYRAGILQGSDAEHSCKPLDNIKRSEVAAILSRMMDETKRVKFTLGEEEIEAEAKALEIVVQPEDVTVEVGETATLTVEVEGGKAPYTYQWQKTVTIIKTVTSDFEDVEGKYEGAKTDTFKIKHASAGSIADISCIITDADGAKVTTEMVEVTFNEKSSGGAKDKYDDEETAELTKEAFKMTINDALVVTNKGIVITGKVEDGKLSTGDTFYVLGTDGKLLTETKAVAIEMFQKILDSCEKGDTAGILLDLDVEAWRSKLAKGMVAVGTKPSTGGVKDKFEQGEAVEYKNEDFEMTVKTCYHITSANALELVGRVAEGKVNTGDTIYINDADGKYVATTKVLGVTMFSKLLDEGRKGDNISLRIDLDVEAWKSKILTGYVASATKGTTIGTRPSTGISRPSVPTRPITEKVFYADLTVMVSPNSSDKIAYVANAFNGSGDYSYNWERSIDGGPWDASSYKTNTLEMDAGGKGESRCKITDNVTGEVIYTPAIAPNIAAKYGPFVNVKNDTVKAVYVHPVKIDTYNGMDAMRTGKSYELETVVIGGTGPYTYQWYYAEKDSDSFQAIGTNVKTMKLSPSKELNRIKCVVTDANGNTVTSEIFNVIVIVDLSGN